MGGGRTEAVVRFSITFDSERYASIVQRATQVEPELRPGVVSRTMAPSADCKRTLQVEYVGSDLRRMRASISNMFESLQMAVSTIEAFDVDGDACGV